MVGSSANSLNRKVNTSDILAGPSGSFSATVASLEANTKYYYKAYMTVWNGSEYVDIESGVGTFTTPAGSGSINRGYLDTYGIPAVSVLTYSSGEETQGSTNYYSYTTSNSNQMVVSHTFAYNGQNRHNYSLLYDKTKHAALWVAFEMNGDSYPWKVSRSDDWKADPAIPSDWQPDLSDAYKKSSTYSRGHQCASNDRRTTTDQTKQTTYFSNMTPQLSGFNSGMWSSLEGDIQKIGNATTGTDMLYVVTGPIFENGYATTPDKNGMECAIPSKYFKCILKVSFSNGTPSTAIGAAYIMNHQNSGAARQEVTIDYVEQITGFDFFANVPTEIQNPAEAETHPTSYFPQKTINTTE